MVENAKKRMFLAELVYEIYNCFEEERGLDLRIEHIEEMKDNYEILIKYRINEKQAEKEYYDYFNIREYNSVMRLRNKYDMGTYNGIIARLIADRLKKEIRTEKNYDKKYRKEN